jgi:membrane protein YdbS with pleckstrin-like domain
MRLVTPGDSAPASIHRYLLPHEQQVITVRRHPAVLMTPIAFVLGGLVVAGVLSNVVVDRNGSLVNWIWWAWLILLAWFVWKVATWSVDYFVITNQRMLLTTGLLTRKVAMMPLAKVTDMSFQRSISGRMLGYGEFVLESAGQDQAFRVVSFLPYPEQLYLEVCSMIFPTKDKPEDDDDYERRRRRPRPRQDPKQPTNPYGDRRDDNPNDPDDYKNNPPSN